MNRILEVCVDSLASTREAVKGGADRLELCSALALGGLTPHAALLRQIKSESNIPVRCLMRPRSGDFLYTAEELSLLCAQIKELKEAGADGFVLGCLTADGTLDEAALAPLIEACGEKPRTLHRAIDVSADLEETYRAAASLGFDTVLTSGGCAAAIDGAETIGRLLALQDTLRGPEVLIGAGVNAAVIARFREKFPAARAFHMSGKREMESAMRFRREGVPMGVPGMDEWHIAQTSAELVAAAKRELEK